MELSLPSFDVFSQSILNQISNNQQLVFSIIAIVVIIVLFDLFIHSRLKKYIKKTKKLTPAISEVFALTLKNLNIWAFCLILIFVLDLIQIVSSYVKYFKILVMALLAVNLAKFFINVLNVALRYLFAAKDYDIRSLKIFTAMIKVVVYGLFLMFILSAFGIEITPLIAALGVGGLAVALALQDTLSNFVSGVQITSVRHYKPGTFVDTADVSGVVVEITWRHVVLKTGLGKLVVVPNSIFSNATVTCVDSTAESVSFIIPFSVAYASDLDLVDQIAIKAGSDAIANIDGVDHNFKCAVSVKSHGESGIDMIFIVKLSDYTQRFAVRNAVLRALYKAFGENDIIIPFPTRTLYMRK